MGAKSTAEFEKTPSDEDDPRHRLAQRYLQTAHEGLAAKEAEKPRSQRRRRTGEPITTSLIPSIALSTLLHTVMLMIAITGTAFAGIWCYVLLDTAFVAGRIVALPTGVVFFATASYASACYLGIIESTSEGHTTPENTLAGGWQDWFWTLPSTLGMLAIAAVAGYAISVVASQATASIIAVVMWLVYPVLQLSTLEAGSPLAPVSLPILRTLVTRPIAWIVFYTNSFFVFAILGTITKIAWRDPPFFTVLVVGPITAIVVLLYAWLLGQLARWLSVRNA